MPQAKKKLVFYLRRKIMFEKNIPFKDFTAVI